MARSSLTVSTKDCFHEGRFPRGTGPRSFTIPQGNPVHKGFFLFSCGWRAAPTGLPCLGPRIILNVLRPGPAIGTKPGGASMLRAISFLMLSVVSATVTAAETADAQAAIRRIEELGGTIAYDAQM